MSTHPQSTIERPALSPAALAARTAPSYCSHPAGSSALALAARLIDDRSTSFWLVAALNRSLGRDIVDAVSDAELLLSVLSARLEELQADPRTPDRSAWQADQAQFYAEKFASEGGVK
jgi:hypothetical protein